MADTARTPMAAPKPYGSPRLELSLDALEHNLRQIRSRVAESVGIMAVIKDSAYGCGALPIARFLRRHGVSWFVVARIGEARALRNSGIDEPILVLGDVEPTELDWAVHHNITLALNDISTLHTWQSFPGDIAFHCNIDTGMGRLGLSPDQIPALADALAGGGAHLRGVFTHFPCADEPGTPSVARQLALFDSSLRHLREHGIEPSVVHAANSAGVLNFPLPAMTHIRPGIALYGCRPDPQTPLEADLHPITTLIGTVVKIKHVPQGTPIGYGWHYRAAHDTCIATVDIGYGQGLPRFLSGQGTILVGGAAYPIAGRVTMDFTMIDAGPTPTVQVGDKAVALGRQGAHRITPDDIAHTGGTIGYEVLCNLGSRLARVYRYQGQVVETVEPHHW